MKVLLLAVFGLLAAVSGYCQDTADLIRQVSDIYTGSDSGPSDAGLTGGFSLWGLFGGFLFGGIGFIAFIYGKKNSEWRPMLLGLILMGYPCFIRGTVVMFITGIALTAALYFFRE